MTTPPNGGRASLRTLGSGAALALLGFLAGRHLGRGDDPPPPARTTTSSPPSANGFDTDGGMVADRRQSFEERVEALGDLGYADSYETAESEGGVRLLDREAAQPGLNLVLASHEPGAFLLDLDGTVVHAWRFPFHDLPGLDDYEAARKNRHREGNWRRAVVLPDGGVVAIVSGHAVLRVDRDSRLVWSHLGNYHHDLDLLADGSILVLGRRFELLPRYSAETPTVVDTLTTIDPGGSVVGTTSLLEAFERSDFHPLLRRAQRGGDIFHTNTIDLLEGEGDAISPLFRAGRALLSLRELDLVAVLDVPTNRIVWTLSGPFVGQHEPSLLANGNLLVFDNLGHHGRSQVLELDPFTQEVEWAYRGDEENDFLSHAMGTCQRLANGNTLITESVSGRAFEVTSDGRVVWHFDSPWRAGPDGTGVAVLFDVQRLPEARDLAWLRPAASTGG